MDVTVERLHNGRYQVVEWAEDGFVVIWEGTSLVHARRRERQHLLALTARFIEEQEARACGRAVGLSAAAHRASAP